MRHPFAEIPELGDAGTTSGIVRIPSQQDVPLTPRVRAIIDTPAFRRLAEITQLALTSRVYPGATHSRFEHALGVYHNALLYLWQLGLDQRFAAAVSRKDAETLIVAALLHDIGHWPFCHPIEDLGLPGMPPHEHFAAEFLSTDQELATVLQQQWNIEPSDVLRLLNKQSAGAATDNTTLLQSILSGPVDIDKMDYLMRDSLHCGVPYGQNFDRTRLIRSLIVNEAGDGLALTTKGRTAAEMMVFARYVMFSEVYWHHAVRSATSMFARSFYELHSDIDLTELFRMTESQMIATLRDAAQGKPAGILLEGLFGPRRLLHKRVAEFGVQQVPELYNLLRGQPFEQLVKCCERLAKLCSSRVSRDIRPCDLLIDAPPAHREVEFRVEIYSPADRTFLPLRSVSPVVDALARTQFDDSVKRARVFATADLCTPLRELDDFTELLQEATATASSELDAG